MTQLAPDLMVTFTRVGEGRWARATTGERNEGDRVRQFFEMIRERWCDAAMDHLLCHSLMTQPGELITRSERDARFPHLAINERRTLEDVGWADISFAMAHVQSRSGSVSRILAHNTTGHVFSKIERAHLSTLADLTSLALSGCVSSGLRVHPKGMRVLETRGRT